MEELKAVHRIKMAKDEYIEPGEIFPCDDDTAARLLNSGAAKLPVDDEEPDDDAEEIDFELTEEMILEAIGNLNPANEEHYTKGGSPDCKAIADQIELMHGVEGITVSADARDQAYAIFKAE